MFRRFERNVLALPDFIPEYKHRDFPRETQALFDGPVVITEKMDGYQGGIVVTREKNIQLQKKTGLLGPEEDEQYEQFKTWFDQKETDDWRHVVANTVVYGEILVCTRTVQYTRLPDWFMVFAVCMEGKYLPWNEVLNFCDVFGLSPVPTVGEGTLTVHEAYDAMPYRSACGDLCEGLVIYNHTKQMYGKVMRHDLDQLLCVEYLSYGAQRIKNVLYNKKG
jgi:hypothetical protein